MRTANWPGMLAAVLLAASVHAQPVNSAFTYQGRLNLSGISQNGNFDFRFQLFDASSAGSLLGTVTQNALLLKAGVFTTSLDFGNQFSGQRTWLEIAVKPAGGPTYTVLSPRQELTAAPNAQSVKPLSVSAASEPGQVMLTIANTDTLNALSTAVSAQGARALSGLSNSGGTSSFGGYMQSTDVNGTGVRGIADNGASANGMWGSSAAGTGLVGTSTSGIGGSFSGSLVGLSTVATSTSFFSIGIHGTGGYIGVRGDTSLDNGYGVGGYCAGLNGYGVYGEANNGPYAVGVEGRSSTGYGVFGYGNFEGGHFSASIGAHGISTAQGAQSYGLWGVGGYTGVRGDSEFGGGASYGMYGWSNSSSGTGIYGECSLGSSAFGVWGRSSTGYAGYFSGTVQVVGTLTKSGGSFKIDHPLDPANKYLSHSFVESPDMMNIYNGIATLDRSGSAVIIMPDWFEALNRDFRYQLTAVGAPGPNLYIARKMQNRSFTIAGGTPGGEVSWQVTGVRQDAWAQAHRIPVEEVKQGDERGRFLHPELYGLPDSASLDALKPRPQTPSTAADRALTSAPTAPGPSAPATPPAKPSN